MSQVSTVDAVVDPVEAPLTPDSTGKLGMWLFLVGDAMSFGGLLAGYGALRAGSLDWPVPQEVLGISLTAFMTFLLIVSSLTMVKGLSAIQHGDVKGMVRFLSLTVLGGVIFLGLQVYEWTHLIHSEMLFTSNPFGDYLFGSTFYIITGFHGAHVTGGVIYLAILAIRGLQGKITENNASVVEIAGLYWHFVDLVWILVFTFVYLI